MTEQKEKNKSGAGKFFLGAALGALAGTVFSRFMSAKEEAEDEEDSCDHNKNCTCKANCECHKEEKKPAVKKTTKKKTADKK